MEVICYSNLKTKKEKDDYLKKYHPNDDPKLFQDDPNIKKDKNGNHILIDEKQNKIEEQQQQIESLTKSLSDLILQVNALTKKIK